MKTRLEEIHNHLDAAYDLLKMLPEEELPELCEAFVDTKYETPDELRREILLCSSLVLRATLKQH